MVIKINKTKNYVVMSNEHLRRTDMSLKAKGLLSLMLSLPEEWVYSIDGLCSLCVENETAIKSALKELRELGYLIIKKIMPTTENGGRINYEYNIFELPQEKQDTKKQGIEILPLEVQGVENISLKKDKKESIDIQNIEYKEEEKENREKARAQKKPEKTIDDVISEQEQIVQEPLREFVKMRKAIKKPVTTHALDLLIRDLKKLSNGNANEAIEIINQSIIHSWQGFYKLDEIKKESLPQRTRRGIVL